MPTSTHLVLNLITSMTEASFRVSKGSVSGNPKTPIPWESHIPSLKKQIPQPLPQKSLHYMYLSAMHRIHFLYVCGFCPFL